MPRLEISLLGPPLILADGDPIIVDTRKATALLAYLAVDRQPHTRGSLALLLWPEASPEHARSSLRRTLSVLRKGLGGRWVHGRGDTLELESSPEIVFDLDGLDRAEAEVATHGHGPGEGCSGCTPLFAAAADLHRGEFLAGFTLRDSANFDEWQIEQAESARRRVTSVLRRLSHAREQLGDLEAAIDAARRWVAVEPLHEPAHVRMMELYALAGERDHALAQYEHCARILEEELGVTPLSETKDLQRRLKDGDFKPAVRPAPQSTAPARRRPPPPSLVGRDEPLQRASDAIESGATVVVVEGEAGIGKTSFARELLAVAGHPQPLAVRCQHGEASLAYGVVTEAMRVGLGHPGAVTGLASLPQGALAEASRVSTLIAGEFSDLAAAPPLAGAAGSARLLEGLAMVLDALATAHGALLIDDVQWADDASIGVVSYLARRAQAPIILTWRSEDVPVDHPLRRVVSDAHREGGALIVHLPRLTEDEVAAMASALGADESLIPALARDTEGAPFLVTEYLEAAREGRLAEGLPAPVRALLRSKVADVSEIAAQVLSTVAAFDRSAHLRALARASGRQEDEVSNALEELTRRGVLAVVDDDTVSFTHDKLRELTYGDTSLARRRLLHRRIAEALAEVPTGGSPAELAEIAGHHQLAGSDDRAADYFARAGEAALALYATSEAATYLDTALALGHPEVARINLAIGDIEILLGDYRSALTTYERAGLHDDAPTADIHHRLGLLHHRLGSWDSAVSEFVEAREAAVALADTALESRVTADWALTEQRRRNGDEALRLGDEALQLARRSEDPTAMAGAHNVLGILAGAADDPTGAEHHLASSLELAEVSGDQSLHVAALNNLSRAKARAGDLEIALELAEQALEAATAIGDLHREAALHTHLADLLHETGRGDEALAHLKEAARRIGSISADTPLPGPEVWKLVEW